MSQQLQRLKTNVNYALYFGFFVLFAGYFITDESSTHHTQVFLGFYLPALLAVGLNARSLAYDLRTDRVLQCFSLLLVWFGITTLWTRFDSPAHLVKLLLMLWFLTLAVRVMLENPRLFSITLAISLAVAGVAVAFSVASHLQHTGANFYLLRMDHLGLKSVPSVAVGKIAVVLMILSLLLAHLTANTYLRNGCLLLALVFVAPLLLSFSRTALLALLLTAGWYYLRRRSARAALGIAGTVLLLGGLIITDNGGEWLSNISRSETVAIRLWGWVATWREISDHIWLGFGLRSPLQVDWSGTPFADAPVPFLHPHNLILAVWYDSGLIGIGLMLALMLLLRQKLQPLLNNPAVRYWGYALLFALIASLADSPSLADRPDYDWIWFWIPLVVVINADKLAATDTNQVDQPSAAANSGTSSR